MDKRTKKKLGENIARSGITYGQVKNMLINAFQNGATNSKVSTLNKGLTKAVAYNIFWDAYKDKPDEEIVRSDWYGVRNAIVEFGDFGNFEAWKAWRESKKEEFHITVTDQEPINPFEF